MTLLEAANTFANQYAALTTKEQRSLLPLFVQIHNAKRQTERQELCKRILIAMHFNLLQLDGYETHTTNAR